MADGSDPAPPRPYRGRGAGRAAGIAAVGADRLFRDVVDDEDRLKGVIPARRAAVEFARGPHRRHHAPRGHCDSRRRDGVGRLRVFCVAPLACIPSDHPQRRLVGAIDIELYTEELHGLEGGQGDDLFQLVGGYRPARQLNPFVSFRLRFPLLCNITGGIAAAFLCGLFEQQLQNTVWIVLFIPVVLALAESVSIQSVKFVAANVARQAAHVAIYRAKSEPRVADRSFAGLGKRDDGRIGVLHLARPLSPGPQRVVGIAAGVTTASVLGVTLPNLLRLFKLDPHLAAGPVVLATTDVLTLTFYFYFAIWFL